MQDTTEDAVRQLIDWFYTQKLDMQHLGPEGNIGKGEVSSELKKAEDETLVELWVLAQKLLIPRLQNATIEEMQRSRMQAGLPCTSSEWYNIAYKNTEQGSALRRYLADTLTTALFTEEKLRVRVEKIPKERLIDIIAALRKVLSQEEREKLRPEHDMERYKVPED